MRCEGVSTRPRRPPSPGPAPGPAPGPSPRSAPVPRGEGSTTLKDQAKRAPEDTTYRPSRTFTTTFFTASRPPAMQPGLCASPGWNIAKSPSRISSELETLGSA